MGVSIESKQSSESVEKPLRSSALSSSDLEIVLEDLDPPSSEEVCELALDNNSSIIQLFEKEEYYVEETQKVSKQLHSHNRILDEEEIISSDDEMCDEEMTKLDFSQGEGSINITEDDEVSNSMIMELGEGLPGFIFEKLYPHQKRGVKFLWDNLVKGSGCILADFMGMGKTLQTATFLHLFLSRGKSKTALIVSPASVNTHWLREFENIKKWINPSATDFSITPVLLSSKSSVQDRKKISKNWSENGGVMVTSYDMFRLLCVDNDFCEYLHSPGPDVIILDEGHKIRHLSSKITKVLSTIKTDKRIILTGYPFQNNLLEYWTMINFVCPNYLGEKSEFIKRYSKPIHKGQVSSNPNERRVARRRAWLLYEKVKSIILRRDVSLLKKILPEKQEVLLTLANSDIQKKMYKTLIENLKKSETRPSIFWTYDVIIMLCNHPDVLYNYYIWKKAQLEQHKKEKENGVTKEKKPKKEKKQSSYSVEEETNNGEVFDPSIDEEEIDGYISKAPLLEQLEGDKKIDMEEVAHTILSEIFNTSDSIGYKKGVVENGGKMLLLFSVMFQCKSVGDRLIVFSRSINTLNFIESTLKRYNKNKEATNQLNFMRFDGSTPFDTRQSYIDKINDTNNNMTVLLISTLAGCEGINLMGANRVALVDVNWNPSHDSEAVCRVFRIGQVKPVFIYRFICENTMEDLVLKRQLQKENLSNWIVDDGNTTVDNYDTRDLYILPEDETSTLTQLILKDADREEDVFIDPQIKDSLIIDTIKKYPKWIQRADYRDQLLKDDPQNVLTEEEKRLAQSENEFDTVYNTKRAYLKKTTTTTKQQTAPKKDAPSKPAESSSSSVVTRTGSDIDTLWLRRQKLLVEKETQEANRILEILKTTTDIVNTIPEPKPVQTSTPPSASSSAAASSSSASHSKFEQEKNKMMKQLAKPKIIPTVPSSASSSNSPASGASIHDPYELDLDMENNKKRKNYPNNHSGRPNNESHSPSFRQPHENDRSSTTRKFNSSYDGTKRYKKY